MLKQQIDQDLKVALLAGDTLRVSVLRGLKSAILYVEVAEGAREKGLNEQGIIGVLTKEAKKRQESADLYRQGGNVERADTELAEKAIIDHYLPTQLSEDAIAEIVDKVVSEIGEVSQKDMGRIIGRVREETAGAADGSIIARLVKDKIGH